MIHAKWYYLGKVRIPRVPNIPTNTQFVNENFKAATSMYQRYTYRRYYIEYDIWTQLMIYGILCLITIRYIFRNNVTSVRRIPIQKLQ